MQSRARAVLLVACCGVLLSACGEGEREPLELVSYNFFARPDSTVLGQSFGGPAALGAFTGSFTAPEGRGLWTLGEEATARFYVVGREVELRYAVSTNPELAKEGQSVLLRWNGHEIGGLPIERGWTVYADTLQIAPEIVRQGWNELSFVPERFNQGEVADPRPLGVFVRSVALSSQASRREIARRQRLLDADELDEEWQYAEVARNRALPDSAPDVMVFVLDAARADHFRSYGYERATTPFVDRLASEGVRWTKAYANAPFTLISTATIMTGLSWRDHHVIEPKDALADSYWTIAQLFGVQGYRTVGFSDNPYVGHASRLDRGFMDFVQVWSHPRQLEYRETVDTEAPDYVQHRPPEMTQWLFEDWVDKGVQSQPYLMYFHIMPPHTPYVPGPEHDLWADPQYRGRVNGSAAQVDEFVNHRFDYDAADLARLVSLYDGNLHRGDEVARRIFEKWRSLGRDRDLLVVLVSDHGEAFGEHGDFEHLTTIYDEMMHVPAVFWPRDAWSDLEKNATKLHGLAEVMPLLLSRAGIALPPGSTWPEYFRRAYQTPKKSRRQNLLVRSYALTHQFGVRNARELLVYDGGPLQLLFDTKRDPEQAVNLRFERPDAYSRRLSSLVRVLERAPAAPTAAASSYSEEDLEALKTIGYGH